MQDTCHDTNPSKGIVAVIPARGGSKGIPKKNIALLGGKPMIAYSIEAALNSRLVDRVIVSTDDEEVAAVAREFGASTPWIRPNDIAGDRSSLFHVWEDAKQRMQELGIPLKVLVKLLPTHPFRTPGLIDTLLSKMVAGCTSVSVMRRIDRPGSRYFTRNKDTNALAPLSSPLLDTNDWPMLRPYGLFSAIGFTRPHKRYIHVINDPISCIDIDTPEDLRLADRIIRAGLFDFSSTTPVPTGETQPILHPSSAHAEVRQC